MECNCNNNDRAVIPWVRGNRLPLVICVYEDVVTQEGEGSLVHNKMERVPYEIQAADTVTVVMKSGFRQVEMPFTTEGNKVLVTDNGELAAGTYTVEVTIVRGDGARGRWQETRQVRVYENTSDAQLGEMYAIEADLFFYAKGDTGNGIADITANPDDTLTITMTDGTTYTTKAMRGEKGDKGDKGDTGTSIVSFEATGQTDVSVVYTVTFSDDTTQEVAVPKGPQGDTGLTGNGIASTTLNSDYTLTVNYTDGTSYTTPSIRGAQGVQGVSVIGFTQTGETETNTVYNLVFSDGRTQSVAIPKGAKGDKGDTGNTGAQGAQGPKGDTVTATDYTLYNVQGGSSEGAMSQDATTKAISAQTGYYTCGTPEGTPEKVVTVESGNLYKRTLGGHFKVKMTNKNTAASGVTLQIGSETAAALWYNGAAVSADNSWEDGEVISVYFDGTNYQASNAQGGGGKAEKIKYDNSASGLASDNVQGVLDTILEMTYPEYDISLDEFSVLPNYGIYKGEWYNNKTWNSLYRSVQTGDIFKVKGNASANTQYAFLVDMTHSDTPNFVSGTSVYSLGLGEERMITIPEGANYIWFNNLVNRVSRGPQYVHSYKGIDESLAEMEEKVNSLDTKVTKVENDLIFPIDSLDNYNGKEYHDNTFTTVASANCRKYDVEGIDHVIVTTSWNSGQAGYYLIVFTDSSYNTIEQRYPNKRNTSISLTKENISVPEGAKYMFVNNRYTANMPIVTRDDVTMDEIIKSNSARKEISILFIGNSLTQDAVTYVPLLLKELAPNLIFNFYIWYHGGYTLSKHLADFNNNVRAEEFSICENTTNWENYNNITMASFLNSHRFDIVSIQEYFNYQEVTNTSVFNSVIEYLEDHYSHPFKVVTLFHQPKRDTPEVIFNRTKAGNALFLKETVAEDMIPSGIATYRALSTSLDSLGDREHLSPDGTHSQEGLPCMMQAYVTAMWILKQVGIPMSVNNASTVVDTSNYRFISVPGANLGTGIIVGTTEQVRLSQLVAINAFKEGEYFVNANLTEYTT